jgi:hypothetical protein
VTRFKECLKRDRLGRGSLLSSLVSTREGLRACLPHLLDDTRRNREPLELAAREQIDPPVAEVLKLRQGYQVHPANIIDRESKRDDRIPTPPRIPTRLGRKTGRALEDRTFKGRAPRGARCPIDDDAARAVSLHFP